MLDLTHTRSCIQSVISEYAQRRVNQKDVEVQTICDVENDHYQLLYMGWEGYKRIFYPIIHIDIQSGKVWIQHNITEELIADDLMNLGIDRHDIVLGLHHPSMRQYTDFAVI
jgi:XisI protein